MPVRIKNIPKTSNGINRHPQEIAFWLREQRCRAKSITFATLANLYGISADEVLDIGGKASSDSLPQCEFQVLSLFKELDPKHQEELLIQITALVRFLHTKNMAPQVSQFLFR